MLSNPRTADIISRMSHRKVLEMVRILCQSDAGEPVRFHMPGCPSQDGDLPRLCDCRPIILHAGAKA